MKKRVIYTIIIALISLALPVYSVEAADNDYPCIDEYWQSLLNAKETYPACVADGYWHEVEEYTLEKMHNGTRKMPSTIVCEYNITAYENKNVHVRIAAIGSNSIVACATIEDGEKPIYRKNFDIYVGASWWHNSVTGDYWNPNVPESMNYTAPLHTTFFIYNWPAYFGDYDYDYAVDIGRRNGLPYSQSDCPTVTFKKMSLDTTGHRRPRCLSDEEQFSSSVQEMPSSSQSTVAPLNNHSSSYKGKEMKIVYMIGIALLVIRIVVPLLLIIIGMIGLVKAMTKNDDRGIKSELKKLVPKLIAAIIIFILPSIVALILRVIKQDALWEEYSTCLLKPSSCNVKLWDD